MTNEPRIITEILYDALPVAETADSLARKLDRSNQRAALLELHARETDHRPDVAFEQARDVAA